MHSEVEAEIPLFNLLKILFKIQNVPSRLSHQHFRQRGWSQLATMPATWTVRGYCLLLLATLLLYNTDVDNIYELLIIWLDIFPK